MTIEADVGIHLGEVEGRQLYLEEGYHSNVFGSSFNVAIIFDSLDRAAKRDLQSATNFRPTSE